jgi:hypothetical protein
MPRARQGRFTASSTARHQTVIAKEGGAMRTKLVAAAVVVAAAAATVLVIAWAPWASSSGPGYATTIDNPYFPLPVGRTWVYRGVKDGRSQVDRVTVTDRTKVVAEGIAARVVTDVATHDGKVLEKTSDWYAQDKQGNVWYVGEDTAAYPTNGKVDRSGSWEAGVDGAEPGLVMEAKPQIPDAYRQEFLSGEAEDTA